MCEDHPLNAEIVRRLLCQVHAVTEWAKDGSMGVSMFKDAQPGHYAAVLMDIRMPKMDGLEAARQIRGLDHADAKTVPIIAMSANAAQPGHYAAVLMDIRMPKMDGLEAARQIRGLDHADAKTVPIIAMSANAYEEDIKKSLEAGMNAHLAKPVEAHLVYETLEKFIV